MLNFQILINRFGSSTFIWQCIASLPEVVHDKFYDQQATAYSPSSTFVSALGPVLSPALAPDAYEKGQSLLFYFEHAEQSGKATNSCTLYKAYMTTEKSSQEKCL